MKRNPYPTRKKKWPRMDAKTALAITVALGHVDTTAQSRTFYDPRDEEIRKKEDVSAALNLLRSWLRQTGLRTLDLYGEWDKSGNFSISRKEFGEGLVGLGLTLAPELVTLMFDYVAEGYKLDYDEFKLWLESTRAADTLSDAEREKRAATYIQACIRGRLERKAAAKRKG